MIKLAVLSAVTSFCVYVRVAKPYEVSIILALETIFNDIPPFEL
jgi:hypothetical protein